METSIVSTMTVLDKKQMTEIQGGSELPVCAALAGMAIGQAIVGSPTAVFFAAGWMAFCLGG
jgi:hypothetical protein